MSDTLPRLTTLANGLRIISQEMPALETVSVGVWVDVGARHETAERNGISHLIEHMAFKGTERRSAQAIAEEIEAVGGHLNAYTSREQTAFFAKILKDDLPLAVDMLSDILRNSVFDDTELERERAVVIQEIGQAHDTPDDIVFDSFQEVAYPDQPLGRPVLGSAEGVAGFNRDALRRYLAEHYSPDRMVVAAAGALDHDRLVAMVEDGLGGLEARTSVPFEVARYVGGERLEARDLEQLHVVIGLDGLRYDDDDYYAAQVLSTLFGGGMSSRLFQEVREKRGLAYSVFSFSSSFVDGGLFGIYAGCGEADSVELVDVICTELKKVADSVDETEVRRARAQLKSGLLMSLESSFSRCEQYARQMMIFGRPIPTSEIVAKIDAVDSERVKAVAGRLLGTARPTIAGLGPVGGLPTSDRIAERLS